MGNGTRILALCALGCAWLAQAQEASNASYDGTWSMKGVNANGQSIDSELVRKGGGGTWRFFPVGKQKAKDNGCIMKPFPVSVTKSTADELTFHVKGPAIMLGCNELTATLKRLDANTLDGTTDGQSKLHIERKLCAVFAGEHCL